MTQFARATVLALLLGLTTRSALAETPMSAVQQEAARLFEEAMRHYDQGDLAGAIVKLRAAQHAAPHPRVLYNLAQILDTTGRRAEAYRAFEEYLSTSEASEDATRRTAIERRLQDLKPDLAWVEVRSSATNATIRIDDEPSSGPLWLDPGEHDVEVEAAGYRSEAFKLQAVSGRSQQFVVQLARDAALSPAPPARSEAPAFVQHLTKRAPLVRPHRSGSVAPGLLVAGAALAGGALALRMINASSRTDWANKNAALDGVPAAGRDDGYWKSRADNAALARHISFVDGVDFGLLVGASVLVGSGVALWLTTPKSDTKSSGMIVWSGTY